MEFSNISATPQEMLCYMYKHLRGGPLSKRSEAMVEKATKRLYHRGNTDASLSTWLNDLKRIPRFNVVVYPALKKLVVDKLVEKRKHAFIAEVLADLVQPIPIP